MPLTGAVLEEVVCVAISSAMLAGYHVYWHRRASRDREERSALTTHGTMQMVRESWVRRFLKEPINTVALNTLRNYIKTITAYKQSSLLICAASCGYVVSGPIHEVCTA